MTAEKSFSSKPVVMDLEEECIEEERFAFFRRLCENKTAVLGLILLAIIVGMAATANLWIPKEAVTTQDISVRFMAPCKEFLFGTDGFGRDIFARVVYGAQVSLFIAVSTIAISCLAGMVLGVGCGYLGGKFDAIVMRIVDVFMCLPPLLFSLSIVAALGNGMWKLILAVSITMTPYFTRVIRATVMSLTSMDYIEAAQANGATHMHIILRHIIPNCMGPIIVEATINLSYMIMLAASLSFIGMGVVSPTPEWGAMLSEGREVMLDAPWVVLAPGLAIVITALSVNLLGDGIRDALDPRMKR